MFSHRKKTSNFRVPDLWHEQVTQKPHASKTKQHCTPDAIDCRQTGRVLCQRIGAQRRGNPPGTPNSLPVTRPATKDLSKSQVLRPVAVPYPWTLGSEGWFINNGQACSVRISATADPTWLGHLYVEQAHEIRYLPSGACTEQGPHYQPDVSLRSRQCPQYPNVANISFGGRRL